MTLRVALLSGTEEARRIADGLRDMRGVRAIASLAGATQRPETLAVPCRIGGFGGDAGFAAFLDSNRIDAVIDATHPFAAVMAERAARITRETGRAHLRVLRPEWTPEKEDRWTRAADEAEAARHIPRSVTVFLATGRQHLDRYGGMPGRRVIVRMIDPPLGPLPFEHGHVVVARPPFAVAQETALFRQFDVDWLVAKNSGGRSGRAKLEAAQRLGLPVVMIARPDAPDAEIVPGVDAALAWVRART